MSETTTEVPLWHGHTTGPMKTTEGFILAHVWGVDLTGLFDVHIARFEQKDRTADAALFVDAADADTGLKASHATIARQAEELATLREVLRRKEQAIAMYDAAIEYDVRRAAEWVCPWPKPTWDAWEAELRNRDGGTVGCAAQSVEYDGRGD